MKSKTFKKYVTIARRMYDLEVTISLGGVGGSKPATPREILKHKKLRRRYNKYRNNPVYLNRLYKSFMPNLDTKNT